jgi:syntaxin 5
MSTLFSKELTYIIKQDIANLNRQIASLQAYTKPKKSGGPSNQVEEHNNNVVMLLQSKLANTSMSFKDVLEIRTQVGFAVGYSEPLGSCTFPTRI